MGQDNWVHLPVGFNISSLNSPFRFALITLSLLLRFAGARVAGPLHLSSHRRRAKASATVLPATRRPTAGLKVRDTHPLPQFWLPGVLRVVRLPISVEVNQSAHRLGLLESRIREIWGVGIEFLFSSLNEPLRTGEWAHIARNGGDYPVPLMCLWGLEGGAR